VSLEISVSDDGNVEMEERDDIVIPFSKEIKRNKEDIVKIVQFPFDKYFMGEFKTAKLDIVISWILGFSREQFARILTAYDLSLNNAQMYLDRHNKEKNTKLELPSSLPKTAKVEEFRKEFRKLPLSSRLHLFDILSYSGFKTKKPKLRLISDMTLYDTRKLGIDEHESANILSNNKLVVSLQDGTGYIDPAYIDVISMATEYAKGMDPVYRQWESDIFDKLSGPDVIIFDDTDDLFEDEND
jgi:hypothetical protein